jgi:DNA-binding NtrC family response regulator
MTISSKNTDLGPVRLLLIDDEKDFVNILAKRFKHRNIDVTKAFSGTEAIQALRENEFDVAVLDLKMEDMDGIEVLKIFKIMDPRLAVIMLTGHGSAESAEQGLKLGAFDYLSKPCELEDLVQKIMQAFAQRKQRKL